MSTPYYEDERVTLYNGDCRDVMASMEERSVAAVITDPPYSDRTHEMTRSNSNRAKEHGNRVLSGAFGFDSITAEDLSDALATAGRISQRWLVANIDYRHAFVFSETPPPGLRLLRIGVWVKTNPNPQISGDRPAQGWEAIAYMHRDDLRPSWTGGGKAANFVLPNAQKHGHPTTKPIEMVRQFVRWFSNPGDVIFDPFAGSGTTLRAALDEGRRAIGVELDEKYCELIATRLSQGAFDLGALA